MKKRTIGRLRNQSVFSLVLMVALMAALWATGTAGANAPAAPAEPQSAPTVLNYQGIVQVDGEPFAGPTGYFKFAIVDAANGNGTTNYWANDGRTSGEPVATGTPGAVRDWIRGELGSYLAGPAPVSPGHLPVGSVVVPPSIIESVY